MAACMAVRGPPDLSCIFCMQSLSERMHSAGLADPGPVVTALWTDKELEAGVTLDAVVTVVDASRIGRQLAAPPAASAANEAEQQIAHADLVLLNKVSFRNCGMPLTASLGHRNSSASPRQAVTASSLADLQAIESSGHTR